MQHKRSKILAGFILSLFLSSTANATLMSRLGGDALYDTESDLTWLTNANLADTNGFGVAGINANGSMLWDTANLWIAGMNMANYLGFNDWRLPTFSPINGTALNDQFLTNGSTDKGYNISRPGTAHAGSLASEMAYLFYNTLGNISNFAANGVPDDGCQGVSCLTNTGPFLNLQSGEYWSGLEYEPTIAWDFVFNDGSQTLLGKNSGIFALAVRSGDVAAVPVPAAVWLMGSALVGLFGFKRKQV